MQNFRLFLLCATALTLIPLTGCVTSPGGSGVSGGSLDDTARYLAGLPGGARNDLAVSRTSPEWKSHQSRMDALWSTHAGRRSHIRSFRGQLGGLGSPGVLFYPFGGPDYLHASALFPGASNYVLVGLEGVDTMPELASLSASDLNRSLGGVANALRTVTGASYFITTEMRADLQSSPLRGTLPLLLAEIARDGKTVQSVSAVGLDAGGNLTSRAAGAACPGWHIRAGGKNIFYFKKDLSNGGLGDRRLLNFVSSKGNPVTFVKSASYLMHQGSFSTVRDYIVNSSRGLVQDPSGVPYRNLQTAGWNLKLYGNYQGAGAPFTSYGQPDLAAAYANGTHPVRPMNFGMGYLLDPKSTSLIVGHR
ncbi:MAG: hypothetical protein KA250_14605 [Verrucomicrobiales bacterium]|nr:hypothetical protein [Verrucomicrobiales bacterium]HQZ26554.1 hypothetical protein [Verrucomicrobiales bacterium]